MESGMILYDGEKIVVSISGNKYDDLKRLAGRYNAELLPAVPAYSFSPSTNLVLELNEIYKKSFGAMSNEFLELVKKCESLSLMKKREEQELELPSTLYNFQKQAVTRMLKMRGNILLASDMGCLSGDCIVTVNRHKNSDKMTLSELYNRYKNKIGKYSLCERPFFIRSFDEDTYRLGQIIDVVDSGEKKCIQLTTEKGKTIKLTPEHIVYCKEGQMEAKNTLGKYVQCEGVFTKKIEDKKVDLYPNLVCKNCGTDKNVIRLETSRFFGYCRHCENMLKNTVYFHNKSEIYEVEQPDGYIYLRGAPLSGYKGRRWTNGVPKHTYVMEQHLGRYLLPNEVVHHIDENKHNNDISNLQLLSSLEHRKLHGKKAYNHFTFNLPTYEKVVKIEDVGFHHVYDVKVLNNNNYLANGILVHNCGKSVMTSVYLSKAQELFPCVLVCPASLKRNWQIELEKWVPSIKTVILTGRNSYNDETIAQCRDADVVILNYDILAFSDKDAEKQEKERIEKAKKMGYKYRKAYVPVHGWVDALQCTGYRSVVLDECQAIESTKAIRSRGVIQLCKDQKVKKLFLSGTPYETRTSQFYNSLHILAPDVFPDEYKFKYRYCNPVYNGFGWTFNGATNVDELRSKLSGIMIRHKMEDVLPELPRTQRIVVYLDIEQKLRAEYDNLEEEMLKQKDGLDTFSYLAKMKKALIPVKIEPAIQYIKDMLELEDKVVVFVYHKDMFDKLMSEFKGVAVGLNGSTPVDKRQDAVDSFQNDDKTKLFIGQIKAAGTGITLTRAKVCIFVEFGNTVAQHEQAECRIRRIGQKADHCLCYYLLVKDTIDEDAIQPLETHNKDIKAVMNGENPDDLQMFDLENAVIAKCKERVLMRKKKKLQLIYD